MQEQIPSEDIVSGWVASFAATDGTSTHSLAKALQQKANKKEVVSAAPCRTAAFQRLFALLCGACRPWPAATGTRPAPYWCLTSFQAGRPRSAKLWFRDSATSERMAAWN